MKQGFSRIAPGGRNGAAWLAKLIAQANKSGSFAIAGHAAHDRAMILEVNSIEIDVADIAAFETGFAEAAPLLRQAQGCEHVALLRCIEQPGRYQVQLRWASLEDHTVGYREGPIAPQVRAIIAPFIRKADPVHFEPVALPD